MHKGRECRKKLSYGVGGTIRVVQSQLRGRAQLLGPRRDEIEGAERRTGVSGLDDGHTTARRLIGISLATRGDRHVTSRQDLPSRLPYCRGSYGSRHRKREISPLISPILRLQRSQQRFPKTGAANRPSAQNGSVAVKSIEAMVAFGPPFVSALGPPAAPRWGRLEVGARAAKGGGDPRVGATLG